VSKNIGERISEALDKSESERKRLSNSRAELRGTLGRIESRFRDLVTNAQSRTDEYSERPLLEIDIRERTDGEKALTLRACGEYVFEFGTHERASGQASDIKRGFYAYSNVRGAHTHQFNRYINDMCGVTIEADEPVFVFLDTCNAKNPKRYTLTAETVFAIFLENVALDVDEDNRLYNGWTGI
jgi:hypothetical protein